MSDQVQSIDPGAAYGQVTSADQRNKVLRNTYWLLALSLLPTVLGAWLGVTTGMAKSLTGAAPSSRARCSRCPPSSAMAIVTAHWWLWASASAAAAMALTSAASRTLLVFT